MSKGEKHDRQDLGFILRENTSLKVRQTNTNFKDKLTVRLLGNDSAVEKSVQVGSEWTSITASVPLVPFVDTPYGDTSAQLEYEIDSTENQKSLPIYEYQTSETDFFTLWDEFDGEYALVKGKDFQLIIPKKDKELVRSLNDFNSLDELIEYYDDLFSYYNKIAGFDNSTKENQNGKNRYFLKADIHGTGSAYYGSNWAANSYDTTDMWLTKNSWGSLHEIAHGYQAGFDNIGMNTSEVSNNLFGVQYQYTKYGKNADNIGWLFNYGKKEAVEKSLYDKMITQKMTYDSIDLRGKLILLSLLKQKAGDDSFTKMYQEYRKIANQPGFNKFDYPLPELMERIYSENGKQDFNPVLEKWGLKVNDSQGEKNRFRGYPAVASLADIIPESELPRARELVDPSYLINSNFEMVQNNEIASLNLRGNLTIQLQTENITDLIGTKAILKDGSKEIAVQEIQNDKLVFSNVANGIYHLEFSGEKMINYVPKNVYVYVKEVQNNAIVTLSKINISSMVNQTITFLGYNNQNFGSFATNYNKQKMSVSIINDTPHRYFSEENPYVNITVLNHNNGDIIYQKRINGTNATVGVDEIPLHEGEFISIYHAETNNRLWSAEDIINKYSNTNAFLVTKYGLQNILLSRDPQQELIKKIDTEGSILIEQEKTIPIPYLQSSDKKELYAAIQLVDEPYKTQYMSKYSSLFIK